MSINCRPELAEKKKQKAENIKSFAAILTMLLDACERRQTAGIKAHDRNSKKIQ